MGGVFEGWDGHPTVSLARLNADCSVETTFKTGPTEGAALAYQWSKDGVDIPGATRPLVVRPPEPRSQLWDSTLATVNLATPPHPAATSFGTVVRL